MLRRATKIQLILFVVITLLGVSYVSAEYVGLGKSLFASNQCTAAADFPDSGGIFTNAEVTYRGVTVGRVGALHLIKNGIRVDLDLDDCSDPKIPIASSAIIANRSVVGEQYVNLIPLDAQRDRSSKSSNPVGNGNATTTAKRTGSGPYIHGSQVVLPMQHNAIPVPTQTLLLNLDKLITSVPLGDLRTTVSELYQAVNARGPDLGKLLDSTDVLLQAALQPSNIDNTIALIDNSATVLQTQLDEQDPLRSWTHSLALLSAQLKASDPDIRRLLDDGPTDLRTVQSFIQDNRTDFGITLANLAITQGQLVNHLDGVEEVLELYPALAAGGQSVLRKPGTAQLGIVLQLQPDPQDCGDPIKGGQGYDGTTRRSPADLSPIAPNVSARCTASVESGTNVRGSANVPGGDPISTSGGGVVYPRAVTKNTVGDSLERPSALGDASWLTLLTDGLH